MAGVTSSAVEHAQPTRPTRRSGAQTPFTGRTDAASDDRSGLRGPATAADRPAGTCSLAVREPKPNGVLLLLSSVSLGLLVVASLTLLRRVKRLNGGWWA